MQEFPVFISIFAVCPGLKNALNEILLVLVAGLNRGALLLLLLLLAAAAGREVGPSESATENTHGELYRVSY